MNSYYFALTDVGQVRKNNEDSFLINQDLDLCVVADGMGGHSGGAMASSYATQYIEDYFKEHIDELLSKLNPASMQSSQSLKLLVNSARYASEQVYLRSVENPELRGMGTTSTYVWSTGEYAFIVHVGDSRTYLWRNGQLHQLTDDHSLVNEQVKAGLLTPEEALISPYKNIITRSIGFEPDIPVDIGILKKRPGDLLLLCSDGLTNHLFDEDIEALLKTIDLDPKMSLSHETIEQELSLAAQSFIDNANLCGGEDNITAALIYNQL